ncbi:hypothetical protein FB451DRAFT_1171301 [Mycena latifolia]|nr:hypothetical protein FB451DRAFT_1171301 [Mycena latifolia]
MNGDNYTSNFYFKPRRRKYRPFPRRASIQWRHGLGRRGFTCMFKYPEWCRSAKHGRNHADPTQVRATPTSSTLMDGLQIGSSNEILSRVYLFKRDSGDPMALRDDENVGEASIPRRTGIGGRIVEGEAPCISASTGSSMMNLETTGSESALQGHERRGTEGKCLWGTVQVVLWAQPCAGDL